MCGIVGFSGTKDALKPVLEGLSRLEYRGYDSAGISILKKDKLVVYKKEGKLDNLKGLLEEIKPESHTAIGHTRWATHGKVNDTNAHPHGNEEFSIVHNGIIENANELRSELQKLGYKFQSETDSEVFLMMLTHYAKETNDTAVAITNAFKRIRGNSAFVIMQKASHVLYAIKRSAPLVCGLAENDSEVMLSSDPYALVGYASKIYFPEDEVLCVGDYKNMAAPFKFLELDAKESSRYKIQAKSMNLDVVSKGDFEHFMLKEIFEQPLLIRKLSQIYLNTDGIKKLKSFGAVQPRAVHFVACGTALHAGMVIKNYFEKNNKLRSFSDFASEFRYKDQVLNTDEVGLFISQSGETADTLACQEVCHKIGMKTFSIVNVEGSTLFRNCDENYLIHAGIEIGVASTKAFTQQVLTGLLLSAAIKGDKALNEIERELEILAIRFEEVLTRSDEIQKIAEKIYNYDGFIFTGRGIQYPIALEGALKLKEIAYVHAEGYAAGELKHGPISLIDENMVNIAIVTPDLYEKTMSNAEEVRARRGVMLIIGEENNKELEDMSNYFIGLNLHGLGDTTPVLVNLVLQMLSYYIAKLKGTDIDKPRNLAKSVTVE